MAGAYTDPMNAKRILVGGLVAGLVMAILDAVTNAALFGAAWEAAYGALGLPTKNVGIPIFWTLFDIAGGVVIAWLYAAMLPRFGPGMKTAIYAAGVEWLLVHLTLYSHLVDHVFPATALLGTSVGELASALIGGAIVRKMYIEDSAVASRA